MFITVLVAADTARRITITKLAATFVVAAPGAELRAVERGKQASAAHLPRDGGQRILGTGRAGGGVLRGIVHTRACAAIGVAHEYAPKLVHCDVVEVEQVSTRIAAALVPNAAALHGVGWCRVGGGPGATAVVRERDIQVPDAQEIGRLRVARCWSSQECISRTVVISGDDLGELRILNSERRASVFRLGPMQAAVVRHHDLRVAITVDVTEIDRVVAARRNRRVAAWADAHSIRYRPDNPAQAVVGGNGHAGPAHIVRVKAALVRDVGRAIRRDAHVSVQAAASAGSHGAVDTVDAGEEVDGNSRPKGQTTVITARAEGGHDVLRAIINRMWIRRANQRRRQGVRTAAYCLMIHAGRLAGALGWDPIVAVIISIGQLAGDSVELRRKRSVRAAEMAIVRERDRIEAQPRKGRALVFPRCSDGLDRIIEGHSQRVVTRLDE